MRPTYAVINLSNLKSNYLGIRRKVKKSKIMAVVKANAYGHGVEKVVWALQSLGDKKPEYYAVALAEEAVKLRELKIKQPILVFEPVTRQEADLVFKYDFIPTVFNNKHLKILLESKIKNSKNHSDRKIKVHVNIDTGMNRLGINFKDAGDFIELLSKNKKFFIDGIYTHFATSDERNKTFARLQLKRFNNLLIELKKKNVNIGHIHAANSGAILDMPDSYFDMVRPGISLYGYYPSLETKESIKLKPVMSIYSYVASIKEIDKGDTVSYGRVFTAKRKTKIISVPIGYADGYNRNLTNKAVAMVNNKMYKQVGRVTMDRIMFDVGSDTIKLNDKVILLGKEKGLEITAWDWSKILNTIPYEITCNISDRVPRIYKG
jgi:alanine racemase